PRRRITRQDFGWDEPENGTLAIIERAAQAIHLMLDIAQRLVRRLERSVLDFQRRVIALEFFQRLQTASHRSDLLLNPRPAGKKRREHLVKSRLKLARALRAKAEEISQDRRENDQRDNARAVHRDCGLRNAECGVTARLGCIPHSTIRNPNSLSPIAIG